MTAIVVSIHPENNPREATGSEQRVQVMINVQAEVLNPEVARRKANVWLLENVGNRLGATIPELVLRERLFWRYEVNLGLPNMAQPGSGALYRIGQIVLDAVTGEVQDADVLAAELQAHAESLDQS